MIVKDYDPKDLTEEFIKSNDWDVIELNARLDPQQLTEYIEIVKTKLEHLYFDFTRKEYLRPEIYQEYVEKNKVFNYMGDIGGWSVSWPVERDIPCPGQYQALPDRYPELANCDFYYDAKIMPCYDFGYFKKLHDRLTDASLRQALLSKHHAGLYVLKHVDGDSKKLHIPFQTNLDAVFTFGDNLERSYHMELGKMYLINPSVPHGTDNAGSTDRIHLLTRVDFGYMPTLFSMRGLIA
jgi:hypothetical protein